MNVRNVEDNLKEGNEYYQHNGWDDLEFILANLEWKLATVGKSGKMEKWKNRSKST